MFSKNFTFKNFIGKLPNKKIKTKLFEILSEKNEILNSLSSNYKNNFSQQQINKLKKSKNFRIIGMGGSILGTRAIYDFLNYKIKNKFQFIDNLVLKKKDLYKKKSANIIVSKSGNTLETISNFNLIKKKNDKNIFITENNNNYLNKLALKLKDEIVFHNNFIGGRYSVLSEVGMLPAELMGLKSQKFKQFNNLVKNKYFIETLIKNVSFLYKFYQNKKYNSIILNYDETSESLFYWYQQLVAESLGKKNKGILPIISNLPKDNHSLMQLYLDGPKNNFFTFFYVKEKNSPKLESKEISTYNKNLKSKSMNEILYTQKKATQNVFNKKKIPFRSFEIFQRSEECLGELFSFFILETILLARVLNVNAYDQPAVELIKKETFKIFKS